MLRNLPSVDKLLKTPEAESFTEQFGRVLTTEAIRDTLENVRSAIQNKQASAPDQGALLDLVHKTLNIWTASSLRSVINASGVIIHTNLGRAPLSTDTIDAMRSAASGYTNLEYDLSRGKRGSRYLHAEELITRITGAESALVVNNNAAAVMLVLRVFANRRKVVISRTQLIEIGGGFRIPDVMKQSGAKLHEIGTTNRVHLSDYQTALSEESIALVLTAHQSNFRIIGFTTEPKASELAELSKKHAVPFVEDLGSGTFLDTEPFGLLHEPTVQESIEAGIDLVTFSGDKLLGGPQAGIIAGRSELVARIKKHPLARAFRADKVTYAGLAATLIHYLKGEALNKIPVWRMIAATPETLLTRADPGQNP